MGNATHGLVQTLMGLPIFQAEWVLWLLLGLSLISIAVMIERWWFFQKRRIDVDLVRRDLTRDLDKGDYAAAAATLGRYDTIETNVVLAGLREYAKGPEPVEDLIQGALGRERGRYEKRLNFLATVASNAPYIGLFGTVLGIIRSFKDLATSLSDASQSVMGGIAEALIATAVGLMVAIPAVIAFNYFKAKVKDAVTNTQFLARTLLSQLKAADLGRLA